MCFLLMQNYNSGKYVKVVHGYAATVQLTSLQLHAAQGVCALES